MGRKPVKIWATGNEATGSWNAEPATFSGPDETVYILRDAKLKVKPLEWDVPIRKTKTVKRLTNSKCGRYQITEHLDGSGHVIFFGGKFGAHVDIGAPRTAGGIEPLKAAAQEHHRNYVLSEVEWK